MTELRRIFENAQRGWWSPLRAGVAVAAMTLVAVIGLDRMVDRGATLRFLNENRGFPSPGFRTRSASRRCLLTGGRSRSFEGSDTF